MVKADVLAALDAARGKYISGQELAQQLGVSRTAIWKAVAALRADGIPVAAVTNRGYILSPAADVLNAAAVTALLVPEVARALQVEVVDRLPGTNAALRARAEDGAPEGLVLIAQAQSAGRGRGGHSFFSPQGGLYLSILLRPEIGLRQAVRLTAMAAVAACRLFQHYQQVTSNWFVVCRSSRCSLWPLLSFRCFCLNGCSVMPSGALLLALHSSRRHIWQKLCEAVCKPFPRDSMRQPDLWGLPKGSATST